MIKEVIEALEALRDAADRAAQAMEPKPELKPVTIEEKYGKPLDQLTPPEGYEFTGEFRPTEKDEEYFDPVVVGGVNSAVVVWGRSLGPQLIVRKTTTVKPERITFERVWENGKPADRPVKRNEFYRTGDGSIHHFAGEESNNRWPIYRRIEES